MAELYHPMPLTEIVQLGLAQRTRLVEGQRWACAV